MKPPKSRHIFAGGLEIRLNADGSLPEWIQIAPYGDHPTRDKKAIQVFNAEAAEQIIAWFNFWPARIARFARLNAIKIYVGHPDFAPLEWPERTVLGSVIELNADAAGLNAKVTWEPGAIEHITKHKYPSSAWDVEINADGTETPVMLWSVGMWHKPNIKTVAPVINACAECESEDPPGSGAENETQTETETEHTMLKELKDALIKAGLIKEDDSDDVALAAIGSAIQAAVWKREDEARREKEAGEVRIAINAAAETKPEELTGLLVQRFNAATAEIGTLNQRITDHEAWRAARINAVVSKAIEMSLITKADEAETVTQLNADFDTTLAGLLQRKTQLNSSRLNLGREKPGVVSFAAMTTQINAAVEDLMEKEEIGYNEAWNLVKADPKYADYLKGSAAESSD